MQETIKRFCPRCKKIRDFETRQGKHNQKIICLACGLKIFIKKGQEVKEDLQGYFSYAFKKYTRRR